MRQVVPLPEDDELLVRVNGSVQVAAGSLLALGRAQRLSALVLFGSLVPTTVAGHGFWAVQRIQFHQNMAMLGGLLFAVLDRPAPQRGDTET